ncbi:MAG: NAD(P)H-binding protein [Myxococcota bacterium]
MQRALVIGGTGFIGRHIVRALVERDLEVVVMRRWDSDRTAVDAMGVPQLVADLAGEDELVQRLAGFNYVFYSVAPDIELEDHEYLRRSVRAMRRLLDTAREAEVDRLAITSCASTIAARGDREPSTRDDVYLPGSSGDVRVEALYAAEQECFREAADNLDLTILNPGICIGDGARFPSSEALGRLPEDARVNVVDVESVAEAHLVSMAELHYGRRYALGDRNTTVGSLRAALVDHRNGSGELWGRELELVDDLDALRHRALFENGCWLNAERARDRLAFRSDRLSARR